MEQKSTILCVLCVCMGLREGYANLYLLCNEGCAASVRVLICVCDMDCICVCVHTLQLVTP